MVEHMWVDLLIKKLPFVAGLPFIGNLQYIGNMK